MEVANKDTDYDELDSLQLELLMDAVWKLRQQRETEQELRQIEWMLSKSPQVVESKDSIDHGLIAQNPDGLILSSINPQILENMASDYLDMLNTSSVIYELDGKIAFSAILLSGVNCFTLLQKNCVTLMMIEKPAYQANGFATSLPGVVVASKLLQKKKKSI